MPLLKEYQSKDRSVNVLFSFPLFESAVDRLAAVSSQLGTNALSVMIDHVDQLPYVEAIYAESGGYPPRVFIKIDSNYGRAGVTIDGPELPVLIDALLAGEKDKWLVLHGVYTHAGQSYKARRLGDAMYTLSNEFINARIAAGKIREKSPDHAPLVLSVGATPTATTIQSPWFLEESSIVVPKGNPRGTIRSFEDEVSELWGTWQNEGYVLEVHAGV